MKNNIKNIDWIDVNLFPNGTMQNKNIRYGFNIFANYDWFGVESYKMLGCCISLSETIKQIEKYPTDQFIIRWEIYQERANQELKAYEDLLNKLVHKCEGLTIKEKPKYIIKDGQTIFNKYETILQTRGA